MNSCIQIHWKLIISYFTGTSFIGENILIKEKVLITGASSGIGLTCAIYLTFKGFKVIGTSRHPEKLNQDILKTRYLEMLTKYKI